MQPLAQRGASATSKHGPQPMSARADASTPIDGQWNVIVAFAGATAPHAWWLDALADGGRLLLPMTAGSSAAASCCGSTGMAVSFAARSVGWVGFYPLRRCAQPRRTRQRSPRRLAIPQASRPCAACGATPMTRTTSCWLHGNGWCLSKRELH